ncbi:MAG: hypothetical protein HYY76_10220 [Acidobacteria bacterium]|nr:hypothetical protein [Acidobacteriota bacterium]
MVNRRFVVAGCAAAVVVLLAASSTLAWSSLARTNHLTFSAAVALPGVVLSPGSYTFQAGPQDTHPNIVRVTTRDGRRVLFMGFTTPVARSHDSRGLVVSIGEAPAGQPKPIMAWYPSDSSIGYQFRY